MNKFTTLTSATLLVVSLFSSATMATESNDSPEIYEDLATICEYYPQECGIDMLGAGNGGGNEPPYTPRKPKNKKKKKKTKSDFK